MKTEQEFNPRWHLIFLLIFYMSFGFVFGMMAQSEIDDVSRILATVGKVTASYDSCTYNATLDFQSFGSDTFETRSFKIKARINDNNPLYGADYGFIELLKDGSEFTLMALNESMYGMHTGSKVLTERSLPEKIEIGSYFESLRNYFIWSEILRPFENCSSDNIILKDTLNQYQLEYKISKTATTRLFLDKKTFLPIISISEIESPELGASQVTKIQFDYNDPVGLQDANLFSLNEFVQNGYTYQRLEPEPESMSHLPDTLSVRNLSYLLSYPFILATGDTIQVGSWEGKFILLDFWFASCLPCQKALPALDTISKKFEPYGLKVAGINCFDLGICKSLETKLKDRQIDLIMLYGQGDLLKQLGINGFPTYLLIHPDKSAEILGNDMGTLHKRLLGILNTNEGSGN